MQQQKMRIEDICRILEIPVSSYGLNGNMPKEIAEKALQNFKDIVKKQHRILAKKYHPDLPSSGEHEEMKMKEINATIDLIMKLKITKTKPPAPTMQFHFHSHSFGGSTWTNNSTTDSAFCGFTFHRR